MLSLTCFQLILSLRHNLWLTGTSKPQSRPLLFAHPSPQALQPHRCSPEWPYRKVPSPDFLRKPSGVRLVPNARRNGKPVHQQTVWAFGAYAMRRVFFLLVHCAPWAHTFPFGRFAAWKRKQAVAFPLRAVTQATSRLGPARGKNTFCQRLQRADLDDLAP